MKNLIKKEDTFLATPIPFIEQILIEGLNHETSLLEEGEIKSYNIDVIFSKVLKH